MRKILSFIWATILSFKIGLPRRDAFGIFLAASTGRKFTNLQAATASNDAFGIGQTYASVLALSAKLGVTGQNLQTYVAVFSNSAGLQIYRIKEDGSVQIRTLANRAFNFTVGGDLSFTDDAGIVRNFNITGGAMTLNYTTIKTANQSLSRGSAPNAVFMDLDINAANAAGGQNLRIIYAKPVINDTGAATGDFIFIDYNPTVTAIAGRHYALKLAAGDVVIGGSSANACSKVEIQSTTQGFMPPKMTTVQRDAIAAPVAGLMIYNTTTNKLNVYTTAWEAVTSV